MDDLNGSLVNTNTTWNITGFVVLNRNNHEQKLRRAQITHNLALINP